MSPQGTASYGPVNLYGYSLPTDPTKTLKSLTPPPTPYVVVLSAVATAPTAGAPQSLDFSGAADVQAAGIPGSAILGGGLDGAGNAYSAAPLPRSLNWAGTSFTLGTAGAPDAVSQGTVNLHRRHHVPNAAEHERLEHGAGLSRRIAGARDACPNRRGRQGADQADVSVWLFHCGRSDQTGSSDQTARIALRDDSRGDVGAVMRLAYHRRFRANVFRPMGG